MSEEENTVEKGKEYSAGSFVSPLHSHRVDAGPPSKARLRAQENSQGDLRLEDALAEIYELQERDSSGNSPKYTLSEAHRIYRKMNEVVALLYDKGKS